MKKRSGQLLYSPSDLIRDLASPFASWMDRGYLEMPGVVTPDDPSAEQQLIAGAGDQHERVILDGLESSTVGLVEIAKDDSVQARRDTQAAIVARAHIIYQAAFETLSFAGFADVLILYAAGHYHVWDTKLARSPEPYYAIQLCCYSEMLVAATGGPMPEKFGIVLGNGNRIEFRVEDFLDY